MHFPCLYVDCPVVLLGNTIQSGKVLAFASDFRSNQLDTKDLTTVIDAGYRRLTKTWGGRAKREVNFAIMGLQTAIKLPVSALLWHL
jgi:hypothetical protein